MMVEEAVALVNKLATVTGCRIFVAEDSEAPYSAASNITEDTVLSSRHIELGFLADAAALLSRASKLIYREHRVGLINVHVGGESKASDVLLESTFAADPSAAARALSKVLRSELASGAKRGVIGVNELTKGTAVYPTFYWTEAAFASGAAWRQTPTGLVRFYPMPAKS